MLLRSFLFTVLLFCLGKASADTVDNYQIYRNRHLLLAANSYSAIQPITTYRLDALKEGDSLRIFFSHCFAGAYKRRIELRDKKGNILLSKDFQDKDIREEMVLTFRDLAGITHIDTLASVRYFDERLPKGVPLAWIEIGLVKQSKTKFPLIGHRPLIRPRFSQVTKE